MDWLDIILGLISGGAITSLFTLPSAIRRARSETRTVDLDNLQRALEGWHQLSDERQQTIAEQQTSIDRLNQKIDTLYDQLNQLRDDLSSQTIINTQLRIEAAKNEVKLCQVRNCKDRTPPTGF